MQRLGPWNRARLKRIVQFAVSLAFCIVLYRAADWKAVLADVVRLDPLWLLLGLACFVPQTVVSAWRWKRMIADTANLSLGESLRHTLAASALNLVVPSKLGDFSKAAFVTDVDNAARRRLGLFVAVEKGADLAMLFAIMLIGIRPVEGTIVFAYVFVQFALVASFPAVARFVPSSPRLFLASTAVLWSLHLLQIHCFLLAADVPSTWSMTATRIPNALLAGIVPAAFCGIGTRDAALVWLYSDVATPAAMAVVGLLTALRYLVPGAVGIPLLLGLRRSPAPTPVPSERSANRRRPLRSVATAATR